MVLIVVKVDIQAANPSSTSTNSAKPLEKILFPDSDAGIEVVGNVDAVVGVGAAPIDGAVVVVELPLWEGTRIDVSTEASTV
jgi:hypothetical protein